MLSSCVIAVIEQQGLIVSFPKGFLILFVTIFGYLHLVAGRGMKMLNRDSDGNNSHAAVAYQLALSRGLSSVRKCVCLMEHA